MPPPIPLGRVANPRGAAGAVKAAETLRTKAATLALRGPMVPTQAFPPGAERNHMPHLAADEAGFVDTGFTCRLGRDGQTLTVTGAPGGIATVGGYRFRPNRVEATVASVDPAATIVALPNALLGQRLAGSAAGPDEIQAELEGRGANPLIAGAFRLRKNLRM
jgi:hypothetical protein